MTETKTGQRDEKSSRPQPALRQESQAGYKLAPNTSRLCLQKKRKQ
jgi:hypothetical protein